MRVTDSSKPNKSLVIGVAGGSGSGKTYFSKKLLEHLGADRAVILTQDSFYRDQSARFDHDGGAINFDHPDALEFSLMARCLEQLKFSTDSGGHVDIPVYDFVTHKRKVDPLRLPVRPVIIVDGILIFHAPAVRCLIDYKIFFATPEALRFERRLHRDTKERGRTPEGVKAQFLNQVKPMHDLFVEPSKIFADRLSSDPNDVPELLKLVSEISRSN